MKTFSKVFLSSILFTSICFGYLSPISSGGGGSATWGSITGTLSSQTDLNTALGLLAPLAGPTFTGTITTPLSSGIVSSASGVLGTTALSGDVTSSGFVTTVGKINGTSLAGLATGILKNTTSTGVPSIAVAADFPTLNQNTTGNATTATTATNATNAATVSTSSNASFYPLFVASSSNGNQAFNLNSGISVNPSTDSLTATILNFATKIQSNGTDFIVPSGSGSTANLWIGQPVSTALSGGTGNLVITNGTAQNAISSGTQNVLIGNEIMPNVATTGGNTVIGYNIGANATGQQNVLIGNNILNNNSAGNGERNVVIGYGAASLMGGAGGAGAGAHNVIVGYNTASNISTGATNVIIGYNADGQTSSGTGNTSLGAGSGPTGNWSNATSIGNGAQATASNSMMFGNSSVTQNTFQGNLTVPTLSSTAAQTTLTGSAGTAICSEPFQGSSYKKVVIYLNGYTDTGTQTYTFPTAFSKTPYVYGLSAGVSGATITTTTATFTTTTLSGFVIAEGY
jgi:hypothetical protein